MKVLLGRDAGAGSPMAERGWQTSAGAESTNDSESTGRSAERSGSGNGTLTNDVEDLLLGIKGLTFARAILEQRGATEVELEEHRLELERLRWRLVGLIRDGPADSDTAG